MPLSPLDPISQATRERAARLLIARTGYGCWPNGEPVLELTAELLHLLLVYSDPLNWALSPAGQERYWMGYPPDGGGASRGFLKVNP